MINFIKRFFQYIFRTKNEYSRDWCPSERTSLNNKKYHCQDYNFNGCETCWVHYLFNGNETLDKRRKK